MTSASAADGVPEPATRRLDPAVARGALHAGALGGGMLWVGSAATLAAASLTIRPLSMAASIGAGDPAFVALGPLDLLGAWASTAPGALLLVLAVLGLAIALLGVFVSVRLLRRAGAARPIAITMLGALLAAVGGTALAAVVQAVGRIGTYVSFGGYLGADAAGAADVALGILPQMLGGVASGTAITAVACTVASLLTWWLAARLLQPRG